MLIRFNVKNFLPFEASDEGRSEEFSMIAGDSKDKPEHVLNAGGCNILKFAAIYGANASGKSGLVKAINFMRRVVIDRLPRGYTEMYCKTNLKNAGKPSYFETEIELGGKYYSYGFEILLAQGQIVSEWLAELMPGGGDKIIFIRDLARKEIKISDEFTGDAGNRLRVYAEDVRADADVLFLHAMNVNKKNFYDAAPDAEIFRAVFGWFRDILSVIFPNEALTNYNAAFLSDKINDVTRLLNAFGTGITGCRLISTDLEKVLTRLQKEWYNVLMEHIEKLQVDLNRGKIRQAQFVLRHETNLFLFTLVRGKSIRCQNVQFVHHNPELSFGLPEESDGTIRLLDLIEILLNAGQKVYVIDELDRCFHPSLSHKFVKTYLELAKNRGVQLIVTTHETRLIDFDLLRRDEIWFVEKDSRDRSKIFSLEEYNTRFDGKIDKAYLEGRFGGVPIFGNIPQRREG